MAQLLYSLEEILNNIFTGGDPEIRTWFLVRQTILPFFLCGVYIVFVTMIGPWLMRNRKPFTLRMPMIVFNFFLVISYAATTLIIFVNFRHLTWDQFCQGTVVKEGNIAYDICWYFYILYILKYTEFLDTIFFVLRKKQKQISVLHVVHHTLVPLFGWMLLRCEKSGFQSIPVLLNAFIHIIMYTYYGLMAIGPQMKKYLWWKKYLTILQMTQFVFLLIFMAVIAPASGCSVVKIGLAINLFCGVVFLLLFYNFYSRNFH